MKVEAKITAALVCAFFTVIIAFECLLLQTAELFVELSVLSGEISEKTTDADEFIPKTENRVKTAKEQPKTILLKNVKLTAYCPCEKCCGKSDGITASGEKAVQGVTAATDKSIPFGARLYIDGVGERVAQDRGGAIRGNRIDVYFDSHTDALEFGVRHADVIVEV